MDATARIGLVGLGTMGSALALNIAERGFRVAVTNRTAARLPAFLAEAGPLAERITAAETPEALVAALARPRAVILMVPAGEATDAQIAALRPLLAPGDTIVDGGNADFHDTRRRAADLEAAGIRFLGLGVSGGEEGARHGPSLMGGGSAAAWQSVGEVLEAIAARFAGQPCARLLGPDGAGHFVKTVHNGIEYADMQLIAEIYGLMRSEGRGAHAIGEVFAQWNEGPLNAYLTEITAAVLLADDPVTGQPVVDVIADRAGQKGTGRWTVIEAQRLGVPATVTEAAVAARAWSASAAARAEGAALLAPPGRVHGPVPTEGDLEKALLAGRILALSQGFQVLGAASGEFGWGLDLAACAEVWRAGCIIRSGLLDDIARAFRDGAPHGVLAFAPYFAARLAEAVPALRRVVAAAAAAGEPAPALAAALAYHDTLRTARGTTNLIQAQRDYFGAHGFERTDAEGSHHGPWNG
jgi:6-phosphogluconate dehydrogenase